MNTDRMNRRRLLAHVSALVHVPVVVGFRPDALHHDYWQIPARRHADMFEAWDTSRLANFTDLMPDLMNLLTQRHMGK